MNILDKIKAVKINEVALSKQKIEIADFKQQVFYNRKCNSLKANILKAKEYAIISEFKRRSPSKGDIAINANCKQIVKEYDQSGAVGISVLTDQLFFGALPEDFMSARESTNLPILRKDFILDEYQIHESKAMGADVILLIAKFIDKKTIDVFIEIAHELELEVLLELHTQDEVILHQNSRADLFGINNRDLNNFNVSIDTSIALAKLLPKEKIKIAESGIHSKETIAQLYQQGFNGFLIGELLMTHLKMKQNIAHFYKLEAL